MPYESIDQLPDSIQNVLLDPKAQEIFMNAFNSAMIDQKLSEERSFMVAWVAVSNAGYEQQDDGTWRKPVGAKKKDVMISGEITKVDEDRNLVFGWASIIEKNGKVLVDHQGDMIKPEELEMAAYKYILTSRKAGEMHETIGVGEIVESVVFTAEKQKALGLKKGALPIGWWIGFKVKPEVYAKVKDGTYQMFSIGGKGIREIANDD